MSLPILPKDIFENERAEMSRHEQEKLLILEKVKEIMDRPRISDLQIVINMRVDEITTINVDYTEFIVADGK